MKWLLALVVCVNSVVSAAPYLQTIANDPLHPPLAAEILYTSKANFDGGNVAAAIVWHKADRNDSLIPQRLLLAGVEPVTWTLLECGAGGNRTTGFLACGPGINLGATLLGPLTALLNDQGGLYQAFGGLIQSPDGSGGVRLSIKWKTNLIEDGGFPGFNRLRFPPRYGVGYSWVFGAKATPT